MGEREERRVKLRGEWVCEEGEGERRENWMRERNGRDGCTYTHIEREVDKEA